MDGAEQGGRVATRDVFTDEELDQLRRFPDISREELIRYFTLTPADEAFVVARHGAANRLGAAVQLCSLPWLGFVPDDVRLGATGRGGSPVGAAAVPGR